jgi:outer membrane protein TolC
MTVTVPASRLLAALLLLAALAGPTRAQQQQQSPPPQQPTAADPMAPRDPLPAPMILRFPSPPEAAGREIGIEEAVNIALANQPTIQARAADYMAAQQRVAQALSPLLPQISGLWNGFQQKSVSQVTIASTGANVTLNTINLQTQATVTASQLLFDFGKNWAATDAAKANSEFAREAVELQKDLIALAVKQSYYNLLLASRLVVVNAQALDRADLNLRSAQGFFDVGTRPKFDVTRAEVDVANARVSLIRAQNAVSLSRISLNTVMGIAVNTPTRVMDILAYEPFHVDRDTLVAEALRRRAEYRQAKYQLDAAEAIVRQNFRNFFPDIVASGTYGAARADMNEIYSYGVQLNWSIFDGGSKIARYKEAKALLDSSRASVRDTELTIWQQVEQAYVNLISAEEQIGAAQKAVESAQENFRLSQGRFDAGVGTIIELTDAQLSLTQAQSTQAQALTDYRLAIAQLERNLGRR